MTTEREAARGHRPDRRALLCGGCAGLLSACGPAVIGIPDHRPRKDKDPTDDPTGEPTETEEPIEHPLDNPDYPCNQPIEPGAEGWRGLSLEEFPELGEVGGWVPTSDGNGFLYMVAHVQEDCYVCVPRRCTHNQVIMDFVPEESAFVCPLHGARFGWDGSVLEGPTETPLEVFFAGREGDTVWVRVTPPAEGD
jgi:cytochrome b6-f complex iron-sulfur subunit